MRVFSAIVLSLFATPALCAQSLAQRIAQGDGQVQVTYASRPGVCGDGESYVDHVLGRSRYDGESTVSHGRTGSLERACVHGPARVVATVVSGEVTRLHTYVGPPPSSSAIRTIEATPAGAVAWLATLVEKSSSRVAEDAMLAIVVADAPEPWPTFLRVARDADRSNAIRRSALLWLGFGVTEKLGIADARDDTDDDAVRSQAVFALSQRPKGESVPELIELARSAKHPSARRRAIFWLGQSGDRRAADVYAELLGLK